MKREREERRNKDRRGNYTRKDLFLYKDIGSKTLCKDFFSCLMV